MDGPLYSVSIQVGEKDWVDSELGSSPGCWAAATYRNIPFESQPKPFAKGPSIKYVRTEGEGGRGPKSVRSKRGCVNLLVYSGSKCVQGGGGGPKSRKICVRTLWMVPNKNNVLEGDSGALVQLGEKKQKVGSLLPGFFATAYGSFP